MEMIALPLEPIVMLEQLNTAKWDPSKSVDPEAEKLRKAALECLGRVALGEGGYRVRAVSGRSCELGDVRTDSAGYRVTAQLRASQHVWPTETGQQVQMAALAVTMEDPQRGMVRIIRYTLHTQLPYLEVRAWADASVTATTYAQEVRDAITSGRFSGPDRTGHQGRVRPCDFRLPIQYAIDTLKGGVEDTQAVQAFADPAQASRRLRRVAVAI